MLLPVVASAAVKGTLSLVFPKETLYEISSDADNKALAKIREAITAVNPRLTSFDLERQQGRIILSFSMWMDAGKAEFKLVGKKPEYYRLAMGVGIAETLGMLTSADKRISALGGSKGADTVKGDFTYSSGGIEQKKVTARPAEGTKKAATKKETPKKVVVKAAPPASKPPEGPQLTKAQRMDLAYTKAMDSKDPAKLRAFAREFPGSVLAPKARSLADRLEENVSWAKATEADSIAAYEAFLAEHPSSGRAMVVADKITALKKRREQSERQRRERERVEKERLEAEKRKIEAEERKANEAAKKEKAKLAKEKAEQEEAARKMIEQGLVALKKAEREKAERDKAEQDKTRTEEAKAAEAAKKVKEAPGDGLPVLVAPRVKAAPAVDGSGDDKSWKKASPLIVTLQGGAGSGRARTAEVRALHTGDTLYLLARWKDASRDASYRPYRWDEKTKTHLPGDEVDDVFEVILFKKWGQLRGPLRETSLYDDRVEADLWVWRAYLTGLSGYASDQSLVASAARLRRATPYLSPRTGGQVWVQNAPDEGSPPWRYMIPDIDAPAVDVDSYVAARGAGSAADVKANGSWSKGAWTVEFARALDTGHADDAAISVGGNLMVSFAAYDKADRGEHSLVKVVKLRLER